MSEYVTPEVYCELLVVGGGTRGLGLAITNEYIARGYYARLFHRHHGHADSDKKTHIPFDLTSQADLDDLLLALSGILESSKGKRFAIHSLTGGSFGLNFYGAEEADISKVLLHNLVLPMLVSRKVAEFCRQNPNSHADLFFYSSAVTQTFNSSPYYVASKSALEAFFKSLVKQSPRNMSNFMMRLGHVDIPHKYFHKLAMKNPDSFSEYMSKAVPTCHFTDPKEVASFCFYLSSAQGMFNGMICDLTGGHSWV